MLSRGRHGTEQIKRRSRRRHTGLAAATSRDGGFGAHAVGGAFVIIFQVHVTSFVIHLSGKDVVLTEGVLLMRKQVASEVGTVGECLVATLHVASVRPLAGVRANVTLESTVLSKLARALLVGALERPVTIVALLVTLQTELGVELAATPGLLASEELLFLGERVALVVRDEVDGSLSEKQLRSSIWRGGQLQLTVAVALLKERHVLGNNVHRDGGHRSISGGDHLIQ